mmetsp:Transcript_37424/g.149318  ORF Transcript_37424/g.149318 Transcript_37424/m.149318 type:complete len:91 (+) Transcript_37424:610-882(+)
MCETENLRKEVENARLLLAAEEQKLGRAEITQEKLREGYAIVVMKAFFFVLDEPVECCKNWVSCFWRLFFADFFLVLFLALCCSCSESAG